MTVRDSTFPEPEPQMRSANHSVLDMGMEPTDTVMGIVEAQMPKPKRQRVNKGKAPVRL
jgi:hypothetical protein